MASVIYTDATLRQYESYSNLRRPRLTAREFGTFAESLTADLLIKQKWKILDRNWRRIGCELDIIAMKCETIVVVEVKAIRGPISGHWIHSLWSSKKSKYLRRGMREFLTHCPHAFETYRIDLAILESTHGNVQLTYLPNFSN